MIIIPNDFLWEDIKLFFFLIILIVISKSENIFPQIG